MKTITIIAIAGLSLVASIASANTVEFDQTGENTQIQICVEAPIAGKVGGFAYS